MTQLSPISPLISRALGGLPTLLLAGLLLAATHGQAADDPGTKPSPAADQMLRRVKNLRIYRITDKGRTEAQVVEKPLMRFTDAVDSNENGSIWLWGTSGRPAAMMQAWRNTGAKYWSGSIVSLSTGLLEGQYPGRRRWLPRKPGIEFQRLTEAPPPAEKAVARLRQMKELSRRFQAHEMGDNNRRFELRLLVQPVHRYADAKTGLLDAAVFLFSRGSDPEIALLLELCKLTSADSPPHWQYAFAPASSAQLHVSLRGREVWHQPPAPGVLGRPTDPYWIIW